MVLVAMLPSEQLVLARRLTEELEELAAAGAREFLFVAAPLAIEGGTHRTSGLAVQGVGPGRREEIEAGLVPLK